MALVAKMFQASPNAIAKLLNVFVFGGLSQVHFVSQTL
jgi:hypothetical protein